MTTATFKCFKPVPWRVPGMTFTANLAEMTLNGVVSIDGERPDNTPVPGAPNALKVAAHTATVVDTAGRTWTIPAGYYELVEA